jgi:hypothetical protein
VARTTCAATRLIAEGQGATLKHPLIGDSDLVVAKLDDRIHLNASGNAAGGMAMGNATVRSVFLFGPDRKIKLTMTYPMIAGDNFDEALRALGAVRLNAKRTVATPLNWRPGEDAIIPTPVSDDAVKARYRCSRKTLKPCLRGVSQPRQVGKSSIRADYLPIARRRCALSRRDSRFRDSASVSRT